MIVDARGVSSSSARTVASTPATTGATGLAAVAQLRGDLAQDVVGPSTRAAPSRISWWVPRVRAPTGPGTANTSRPCSAASGR